MSKKKKQQLPNQFVENPPVLEEQQPLLESDELPVLEKQQPQVKSDKQSVLEEQLPQVKSDEQSVLEEQEPQIASVEPIVLEEQQPQIPKFQPPVLKKKGIASPEKLDTEVLPEHSSERSPEALEQTESEPEEQLESEPEQQQRREKVPGMFQAIGVVTGIVKFSDEDKTTTITIDGKEYVLFYVPRRNNALHALRRQVECTGEQLQKLVVYPHIVHFPDKTKQHLISFQLVAFAGSEENDPSPSKELESLEFKLSGLWQFIPVSRIPCISVFKNYSYERKEYIKEQDDALKKARYMKASHVPLIWKDALVPPFRFNPTLDKDQQAETYFVSIKAKFNPRGNIFEFDSMMAIPQDKAPRFLKVSKADKVEAQRTKVKARKAAQKPIGKNVTKPAPKPVPKPVIKPKVATNSD